MSQSLPPRRWSRVGLVLVPLLLVASACSDPVGAPTSNALHVPAPSNAPAPPPPGPGVSAPFGIWSAAGPGTVTLNNDGSTGAPSMSYALSGGAVFSAQNWTFRSTAGASGPVTVPYDYSGFHAYFNVHVWLYAFVTNASGTTEIQLVNDYAAACCTAPSGHFHYTGSHTFNLQAGDVYGFRMGGYNFDSDSRLLGTLAFVSPDNTPPVIASNVTGTLGDNGWYTSDVGLTWSVSDAQSAITNERGCDPASVTNDTPGAGFTCTATSAGGTNSETVTIKRDATAPVVTFAGNAGSYTVDQAVSISCSATDATSGVASDCTSDGVSAPAYTFGVGPQTLTGSATDNAGNVGTGSTSFTVSVTAASLCTLTQQWVSKAGVAHSMCQQLANGAYGAYANHVRAQSGKSVSAEHAALLVAFAGDL